MKRFLHIAGLIFLIGLAAFTTVPNNKSRIVVPTASGDLVFNSGTMGTRLNEDGNLVLEFKISAFTAQNRDLDLKFFNLMGGNSYPVVYFTGNVEKSLATLKAGSSFETAAIGKLKFAGREYGHRIPMKISRLQNGDLAYSLNTLFDLSKAPATAGPAKEMKVTGPVRMTFTPVLN